MKTIDWQGHRGARGILPENTIPAFLKALEYSKITSLELDIAISKDQQVIVTHEPWFSEHISSHPNGNPVTKEEAETLLIYEMTYEEIKQYDCGIRGNNRFKEQTPMAVHKPSLKDMVKAVQAYCKANNRPEPQYNIEIKSEAKYDNTRHPQPAEFVDIVLKELKVLNIEDKVCLQSFDIRILEEVNKAGNYVNALLIWDEKERTTFEDNLNLLSYQPTIYSPYFMYVDEALVKAVHAKGMKLIPWTVNEIEHMKHMLELGCDGIITDYPNRIID